MGQEKRCQVSGREEHVACASSPSVPGGLCLPTALLPELVFLAASDGRTLHPRNPPGSGRGLGTGMWSTEKGSSAHRRDHWETRTSCLDRNVSAA